MHPNRFRTLALALALAAAACSSSALPPGHEIGTPIAARPILHFAVVDAAPEKFLGQTLLVLARVRAVCQQMGCWMQIEDEGRAALVRWETGCGGKYAFPKDAAGKRVLVQGSFQQKELSPEEAEHLEQESGGKTVARTQTCEFNASAVRILD